ncbi:MAG: c-type cytochrome [Gammaproteobacteria bacterium]|nr:c-type cytochrome [Gammaproteobacteria bacterium]
MRSLKGSFLTVVLLTCLLASINAVCQELEPFNDRYCTTCHGADGRGNEGVQAPRLAGMEDWYLIRQLENFRAGIRGMHPQDIEGAAMQPMAAKLSDASIADIVEWADSWPAEPAGITVQGDVVRGEKFYAVCATCHGVHAEGSETLGAPAMAGQNDWYLVTQLKNFMADYRGNHRDDSYGQQMRSMARTLGDEVGIRDVVSYINTFAER